MSARPMVGSGPVTVAEVREVFRRCLVRVTFLTEGVFRQDKIESAAALRDLLASERAGGGLLCVIGRVGGDLERISARIEAAAECMEPDMTGEAATVIDLLNLAESSGLIYLNFSKVSSDRVLYGLIETLYDVQQVLERAVDELDAALSGEVQVAA